MTPIRRSLFVLALVGAAVLAATYAVRQPVPSASVDEYAATLARWYGGSSTDIPLVIPDIGRFARPDLGVLPPV